MSARLVIRRASPLTTIQDAGRFGMLRHGVSASGPMDRAAFALAGELAGGGIGGIEFTRAGIEIEVTGGSCCVGFAGGVFEAQLNGQPRDWPGRALLQAGDRLAVTPGAAGNYGYLRFAGDLAAQAMMGSIATSSRVGIGGLDGRALKAGDTVVVGASEARTSSASREAAPEAGGPIRVIWGLHAEAFSAALRQQFVAAPFVVSTALDRMGVRLEDPKGVFAGASILSLVSDAVVPGDIQILGDGTPIVLMRDHQPTGGYPRIATVISADMDRFAQLRPGTEIAFVPVTVEHAHRVLRSTKR